MGFILNSKELKVYLTEDKEEKFVRAAQSVLEKRWPTIREVAGVPGLMVAYAQAFRYGEAHYKRLEIDKIQALT